MSNNTDLKQVITKNYRNLPLTFVPNMGQFDSRIKYYSQNSDRSIYFTPEEAIFLFIENNYRIHFKKGYHPHPQTENDHIRRGMVLALHFLNANPDVKIEGQSEGSGKVHYLKGNDQKKWIRNLSTFEKIVYRNLWSGVDLVFLSSNGQLKYELVVQPGANIKDIQLTYRGVDGLSLDSEGNLQIETQYGVLIDERPVSYQEINGQQVPVTSSFNLVQEEQGKNGFGFEIGNEYDSSFPLIIDPLTYSTYLGGGGADQGLDLALDAAGQVYVTGTTDSMGATPFPTTAGAFDTSFNGGTDVFVTKLNADGTGLIYSTYLGGDAIDQVGGIAVDAAGQAYVAGTTQSANFPTTQGAFDTTLTGPFDVFVTKLSADGSTLIYSTYLGGSSGENGFDIAVNAAGEAYVTGTTGSMDFPTTPGAFDTSFNGNTDVFVTKLNSTGSGLVYSTFLGGGGVDQGNGIVVDAAGQAYVTGSTSSSTNPLDAPPFPTTAGAFDTSFNGGLFDAFVTKLAADGSALVYSTYLGGGGDDAGLGITVDTAGQVYVTGLTNSTGTTPFPTTAGAFDITFNGGSAFGDAFVTKLNAAGSALVYSTYLGGSGEDRGFDIAVNAAGEASVTGDTNSTNFPITPGAFSTSFNGGFTDAYVTKLTADGSGLVYSTYLGGGGGDAGASIAVDSSDQAYVTGATNSMGDTPFPTTAGAFDTSFNGGSSDAFVTKLPLFTTTFTTTSSTSTTSSTTTTTTTTTTTSTTTTTTTTTGCPIANPQTCCQVVVEFKTQLVPPALGTDFALENFTTEVFFAEPPVVEDVCPEKVIICGKLTKRIIFTAVDEFGTQFSRVVCDERPFQCFIDRDDANEGDTFTVCGYAVLCEGTPRLINQGSKPGPGGVGSVPVFWKFTEKDIVKVCIRKGNNCGC